MTKEQILEYARAGYVLVIEPDSAFLDGLERNVRLTLPWVNAMEAAVSDKMRLMQDAEVIERVHLTPRGRFFFEWRERPS
jgi:hypothetical protein